MTARIEAFERKPENLYKNARWVLPTKPHYRLRVTFYTSYQDVLWWAVSFKMKNFDWITLWRSSPPEVFKLLRL